MAKTILGKVAVTPKGEYSAATAYEPLDIVSYHGESYMALTDVIGIPPANSTKYMRLAARGVSGCFPIADLPYRSQVELPVNTECRIAPLTGDISITLGASDPTYASEWCFVLTQGATAHEVTLPTVRWTLGIAPTFEENSVTEVRLWQRGDDAIEGTWRA